MDTKKFLANAYRFDPCKNFRFRVLSGNKVVLAMSKASALRRDTEVIEYRDGGDKRADRKPPEPHGYQTLTLERGIACGPDLADWANRSCSGATDSTAALVGRKKDLALEVMDEDGQVAERCFLRACWVSKYIAVPGLDANGNAIAIENVKIELESWERDVDNREEKSIAPAAQGDLLRPSRA